MYKITEYTKEKAKRLGVEVYQSTRKNKKIIYKKTQRNKVGKMMKRGKKSIRKNMKNMKSKKYYHR